MEKEKFNTVIIGAGQAGLAAGYYLKKTNDDFIILDEENETGDSWRKRWDSLRLFTPSEHDGLPGFPFPAKHGTMPTKEEMADYLSNYVIKFSLPVRLKTKVLELKKITDGYEINTTEGKIEASNVIVATGTNPKAYIPAFAKDLSKKIVQIHSSEYKNPQSFPASDTMVVGVGTSGVEIAVELSKSRRTFISGKPKTHIPDFIFRYAGALFWFIIHNILTIKTPAGKKARPKVLKNGAPLISVSMKDIKETNIEHLPRLKGVQDGIPLLEDGKIFQVSSIVWATGYKPDFSWIKLNITEDNGWPKAPRGISKEYEGLFFMGMAFQFGLTSGLVGGVGRDAAFVVTHIKKVEAK